MIISIELTSTHAIKTDLVELRPLRECDRLEFIRVHQVSAAHFGPWLPQRNPLDSLDHLFTDQLQKAALAFKGGTELRLGGWLPDGRLAGLFSLSQIHRGPFLSAYAGWQVSADCLARGVGTSGVLGLLDLAFAPEPIGLGLHRVQANVIPTNTPSLRVAEKVGFRLEGKALRYLKINGQWQDHLMFAKLADEHTLSFLK